MILDFLVDPGFLERWGYIVVFCVALLEAIPFVGLLVPGPIVLAVAGVLAGEGLLDVRRVLVAAILGGLIGQALGYYAGREVGRRLLDRFGPRFRITQVEIAKTERLFRKHGVYAVFLGHFSFLTRGLVNLFAGVSRYPARLFFPVTVAALIVWSTGYTALGFVFGEAWRRAANLLGSATLALVLLAGAVAAAWWLARRWRASRSKR